MEGCEAEYGLFLVKVLSFILTVLSATLLLPWAKTMVIQRNESVIVDVVPVIV